MFNFFKKHNVGFTKHRYRYLTICLPSNWLCEEEGDIEACFNPKHQSTMRISFIKANSKVLRTLEDEFKSLTSDKPYK